MQATIMQLLGIDHTRLTYRYQGRQFRLTDVHGKVVTVFSVDSEQSYSKAMISVCV